MIMALEQALFSSSSAARELSLPFSPRNRVRKLQNAFSLPFFPHPLSSPNAAKQLRLIRRFHKISATENFSNYSVAYPKPSEIPWKKELSNSVSLIGTVGIPVEIKHLTSGKAIAWTRIAVWKSSTDASCRGRLLRSLEREIQTFFEDVYGNLDDFFLDLDKISLTFWDELAHVAFQHVQKGNQIYVSGRLVADIVEADDGKQQTYSKVVVQQLNFIERSSSTTPVYDQDSSSQVTGKKLGNGGVNNTGSTEELWQAFFANPVDWWDNRKNKKNPKYPDFKHKDTGEALWVEGRYNPTWVKSQLAILDMRMGSLVDQEARMQANFLTDIDFQSF